MGKIKKYRLDWEKGYLESSKDFVFKNTFKDFELLNREIKNAQAKHELEIYDVKYLYNLDYLVGEKMLGFPLHLQFVMGVLGGITGTLEDLVY